MRSLIAILLLCCGATLHAQSAAVARAGLLDRPGADAFASKVSLSGSGSRAGFYAVLESPLFLKREVGPFDLFVMQADGFAEPRAAQTALDEAAKGLQKLVPVMEEHFPPRDDGIIGGRRLPIVLTHAAGDARSYDEMLALLDWAEGDWTGWVEAHNPLWDPELREAVTARTWEAQVFNLAHPDAVGQHEAFYEHGLGYYTLAHIVASVLNQGAWGLVPPFVAQGLIDELDIQAYGEAWVGGDWWVAQTPGWYREGWSGFVPQGSAPPAPVTGPPADLAVTISESGDSWQHRKRSESRHWSDLAADRESAAPASFSFMAEHESFLPRDRALARAFMHLLLELAPPEDGPGLFDLLDREPKRPLSGMPDAEPLPAVFARVLGGVPEVAAFEAQSLERVLQVVGREDIGRELTKLGAEELLELSDHRDQCQWLYGRTINEMDMDTRVAIWNLILTAEYYQQLHEWKLLGAAFDRRVDAALAASKKYPSRSKDVAKVAAAFRDPPET